MPCTIDGKLVPLPKEDSFALTEEDERETRVKELGKIREAKRGQKPERTISAAKHFGFDRKK